MAGWSDGRLGRVRVLCTESLRLAFTFVILCGGCCPSRDMTTEVDPRHRNWGEELRCKQIFSRLDQRPKLGKVVTRAFRTESTDADLCNIRDICLSAGPTPTIAVNIEITGDDSKFRVVTEGLEPSGGKLGFPKTHLGLEPHQFIADAVFAIPFSTTTYAYLATVNAIPEDVRLGHAPITILLPYWSSIGLPMDVNYFANDRIMKRFAKEHPPSHCTAYAWLIQRQLFPGNSSEHQ